MWSLGRYCQGLTRCSYAKKLCRYFATDTVISHFTQGPKLPAQSTTSCICKINSESHLRNQATIESPPHCRVRSNFARKQPKSRTRTLTPRLHHRRPRSPSCALSTDCPSFRKRRTDGTRSTTLQASLRYLQSTRTPVLLLSPAVSARPPIRLLPLIPGNLESGSESSTKSNITNLRQTVPERNVNDTYASKLKICIYMQNMHILAKYASRCRNKHFKICKNMQYQICRKYAQYAQMKYEKYMFYMLVHTTICKSQICIYMQISICKYMQKICRNMQILNMHKYAFLKYA